MTTAEERRWLEEREKVLEEWSEIELRFREGTPVRIELAHGDSLETDPGTTASAITSEPRSWSTTSIADDPLVCALMAEINEEDEKSIRETTAIRVRSGFISRCVCRPAEQLQSDEFETERIRLLALAKRPYTQSANCHWQMLTSFYRIVAGHALGDDQLASECPPSGAHWHIVGFQGVNPSTDFRGLGALGLLQLYCLSQTIPDDHLNSVVKLSRNEPNDFPLAVVCLNITALIIDRLRTDLLNGIANREGGFLKSITKLHTGCLVQFCKLWKQGNCTYKDCSTVLGAVNIVLRKDPTKILNAKF